jgi:hypothetical protein
MRSRHYQAGFSRGIKAEDIPRQAPKTRHHEVMEFAITLRRKPGSRTRRSIGATLIDFTS